MLKSVCMVVAAAMLVVNVVVPPAAAAMGCGTVVSYLNSCIPYVTDRGPLGGCCNGVEALYAAADTAADRQSICNCLQSVASSYTAVNFGKAAELPARCGVNIPYKISPSTDCAKVQ
ncbi:non-specific lipid-transfer protein 2-like [Salvia miltiorrhiza]|uniref:non-specific lipid-transfer protein 2-like n=1 Tax=Salvia miltiorrhiza TaxID=226208 RepID=UPI0025ACEDF5|nr:non-specific lipid-transfer protein 2-like [Salvia miltiorrhiza]